MQVLLGGHSTLIVALVCLHVAVIVFWAFLFLRSPGERRGSGGGGGGSATAPRKKPAKHH